MALGTVGLAKDQAVYVSLNKEATYGTAITVARKLVMGAGYTPVRPVAAHLSDGGFITGVEGPSIGTLLHKYYTGSLVWDHVHPDDIAFCLAYILGTVTTGTVDTSAEEHFIEANVASQTIPSFSLEETYISGTTNKYSGCTATAWNLSKAVGQPATMRLDFIAKTKATGSSATPAVISGEPIWGNQPVFCWLGATLDDTYGPATLGSSVVPQGTELMTGTPEPLQAILRSFSIDVTQAADPSEMMTMAGAGLQRAVRAIRSYSFSMDLETESDTFIDYTTTVTAGTEIITPRAIEFDWKSALAIVSANYYGARFAIPKARLTDAPTSALDAATGKRVTSISGVMDYNTTSPTGLGHAARNFIGIVWNNQAANSYAYSA